MEETKLDFSTETLARLKVIMDRFSSDDMRTFCEHVLQDADEKSLVIAMDAVDVLIEYLKARRMYIEAVPNKQTDVAIAGVLLHNVYSDVWTGVQEDWKTVFRLREKQSDFAWELAGHNPQLMGDYEYTFQIVEAQMGEDMPVIGCRPVNGQITYIVWEVLWLFYRFIFRTTHAPAV